jgi:hypothetical protein
MENWIDLHPWMTFILGMMGILTVNTMFISIGGGYKKFPPQNCNCKKEEKEEVDVKTLLRD